MVPVTLKVKAGTALLGLALLAPTALAQQPKSPAVAAPATPAAPAPAVAPSVRAGVDLWRAGDYPAAVAIWQPFAAAGDADAMFNLGQAHKLGRAVPVDKVLARDWYRKAALKNHLPAQANLGILLFQAGEKPEAARWLKQAADRGEMRAQYVLGVAHWNGDGVSRNLAMAYAYLTRASAQGLNEATGALSNLSRTLSPVDRTSGAAIAASLAAGNGVPTVLAPAPPAGAGMTAADLNRRGLDAVQKPAPRPTELAAAPVAVPATAPVVRKVDLPTPEGEASARATGEKSAARPVEPDRSKASDETKLAENTKLVDKPKGSGKAKIADKAKTPEPPAPSWRVQLGAFGSRGQAETAWTDIKKKQKTAIGKAKPIYDPGRSIVKLQLGPYKTRTDAKDACAKLAFAGQACFVTEG